MQLSMASRLAHVLSTSQGKDQGQCTICSQRSKSSAEQRTIFVFGRMIRAETKGGDSSSKVPISTDLRMFSILSKVRMSKSSSKRTKVPSNVFTEEVIHKEEALWQRRTKGPRRKISAEKWLVLCVLWRRQRTYYQVLRNHHPEEEGA